jgi:hypothetical protein
MDRPSRATVELDAPSPRRRARWRGPMFVVLAMVVGFAVGVLIASRSQLFPPQVRGAVGRATTAEARDDSTQADAFRWRGAMVSRTSQRYSAGSCVTVWRSRMRIATGSDGVVRGVGRARLAEGPRCPFPMSQPQIRGYEFDVGGRLDPREGFLLSIERAEPTEGIFDYGGFASVAASGSVLEAPLGGSERARGRSSFRTRTSLGNVITSRTVVRLRCQDCGSGRPTTGS